VVKEISFIFSFFTFIFYYLQIHSCVSVDFNMRFSKLVGFLIAGAACASASPIPEPETQDGNAGVVRDVKAVNENCDVITPKVFIISMVTLFPPLLVNYFLTPPVRTRRQHLVRQCQHRRQHRQPPRKEHHGPGFQPPLPRRTLPGRRFSLPAHNR
jgi:hypothetical protein